MSKLFVVEMGAAAERELFVRDWLAMRAQDPLPVPEPLERILLENAYGLGARFLLAYDGAKPVGRVAVRRLLTEPYELGTAACGLLGWDSTGTEERRVAILQRLIDEAEGCARESGARTLVAPMCLSSWLPYRVRVDMDARSFAWEPARAPSLLEALRVMGFEPEASYYTWGVADLRRFVAETAPALQKSVGAGYRLEKLGRDFFASGGMARIHSLNVRSFRQNVHFEELPRECFENVIPLVVKAEAAGHTIGAFSPDGELVGFAFSFLESGAIVFKTAALLPTCRGLGLSNAMLHVAGAEAMAAGIGSFIAGIVRGGWQSESYARHGTVEWTHEYRLLKKRINADSAEAPRP